MEIPAICIYQENDCRMDALVLSVIHPASEKLKRNGIWFHLAAGVLILTHAFRYSHRPDTSPIYFWCQLLISVDILLLVVLGRNLLRHLPRVNLFFRIVEILFFLGMGLLMLLEGNSLTSVTEIGLGLLYIYLFYCEKGLRQEEWLSFHHIGITIPGLPENKFIQWTHINDIEVHYDSIDIRTSEQESLHYDLRKNLDFVELEQIHEFRRHYLGDL